MANSYGFKMNNINSPCLNCKDRQRITTQYGNCHNEHCPNGWFDYQDKLNNRRELVGKERDFKAEMIRERSYAIKYAEGRKK